MLKTTSQQIIDDIGIGPTEVGRPVVIGSIADGDPNGSGNVILKSVPEGHVFLCTKVLTSTNGAWITGLGGTKGTNFLSPNVGETGGAGHIQIDIENSSNQLWGRMRFQRWARYETVFDRVGSPDWRSAQPLNIAEWTPKYPIAFPSGYDATLDVYDTGAPTTFNYGDFVPGAALYGVIVPEATAHQYGYPVQTSGGVGSASLGVLTKYGVASTASLGDGDGPLVEGIPGHCIRILDMHIRMQPTTNTLTSVRIGQGDFGDEANAKLFLKLVNSNPAEPLERQFSPDIILRAGEDLCAYIDAADYDQVTVNVHYEMIPEEDAPKDQFFGVLTPNIVTPGDAQVLGASGKEVFDYDLQTITLYFPGTDTTETTSGKGFQYLVRGYSVSFQKEGSHDGGGDDTDQQMCAIVASSTSSTSLGFGHSNAFVDITAPTEAAETGSELISPVFAFCGQSQNLTVIADGLNAPVPQDNGQIRFNYISFNAKPDVFTASPVPARYDGSIDDWACSVWGRRVPNAFTAPISRTF